MIESAQKYLDKQDANMFFAYPVTDDIAPLYSQIIASPMDFSTMKNNIIRGVYTSIEQYKAHAILVFDNCMRYNSPDTIFYQEAKRIKDLASIYFAREEKIFFDEVDKESKRLTKPQLPISSFSTKRPKAEGPTLMIPHHEPTTVVTAPFLSPYSIVDALEPSQQAAKQARERISISSQQHYLTPLLADEKHQFYVPKLTSHEGGPENRSLPPRIQFAPQPRINAAQRLTAALAKPPILLDETPTPADDPICNIIDDEREKKFIRSLRNFSRSLESTSPLIANTINFVVRHTVISDMHYVEDPRRRVSEVKLFARTQNQMALIDINKNLQKLNTTLRQRRAYAGLPPPMSQQDKSLAAEIVGTFAKFPELTRARGAHTTTNGNSRPQTTPTTAPSPALQMRTTSNNSSILSTQAPSFSTRGAPPRPPAAVSLQPVLIPRATSAQSASAMPSTVPFKPVASPLHIASMSREHNNTTSAQMFSQPASSSTDSHPNASQESS